MGAEVAKADDEHKAKKPRSERRPRTPENLPVSEELIIDP